MIIKPIIAFTSVLFCLTTLSVNAENKITKFSNDALAITPNKILVKNPVQYFRLKEQAITHCKNENWQLALPILQKLTKQFKDDGETWYLLGLSYRQNGDFNKAAKALKESIQLGSRLKGIPTGASNPNDVMVKIAEIYAQLEDEQLTKAWLTRALNHRWDDKPKLSGRSLFQKGSNPYFAQYENKPWFKQLAGTTVAKDINRIDGWKADLSYLVSEIKRLHVDPFHHVSEAKFNDKVEEINKQIAELDDQQIIFQFMELLDLLNNGHNFIIPAWGNRGNFSQLPFQFYQFADGLFIVNATDQYKQFIGHKVVKFNSTSAQNALALTDGINPRDNNMQRLWLGPYYLSLAEALEGLGIVKANEDISLTLENANGEVSLLTPTLSPMTFSGFPKLPPLTDSKKAPFYLSQNSNAYWKKWLSNEQILYVQFNDVRNKKAQNFAHFNADIQQELKKKPARSLVIDLRHNSGGDGSITPPMLKTAVLYEALNPDGKLFVLAGRNTFSAGHDLLMKLINVTDAIIVGEPSGTRPNTIGEAGWFNLPYSGQTGIISSQFHQKGSAEDHRIWIAPDVPVSLSSEQYFSGIDPLMAAVTEITN